MKKLQLYRSVVLRDEQKDLLFSSKETMRPPGNVPYIVDNLWEWQRPLTFPCRRFSAYASPTPELALQSGPKNGKVFRLEFLDLPKIAHLKGYADSKYHPECN
ncbi:hypothetical protein [Desulfobulbus alkaliphilus]|uniref:hypothetical protein n=1 Tax=Desulfobulbus alkaliphilus TaxID=869814 RepID=UPI00196319AB|nr:hypothetical protein [Desulfobulbus alkaliphilus]MBM9536745.1 hypothetical protein [Desulfobulbus alkaliphilus]